MKVYLIAGEESGDRLGQRAMREIKARFSDVEFFGVGGALMEGEGLRSLFPMEELSVMGIFEIAPKLMSILKRIKQTIENIEEIDPDIVLTIDAPDFGLRVSKAVHKRGKSGAKLIHFVAPTVWAWREKRAERVAKFLDGIMCLLPFEPPYFERHGLKAGFVGHPVMHSGLIEADGSVFRSEAGIAPEEPTLGVFFGSRRSELNRLGPIILDTVMTIAKTKGAATLIVPTLPHLRVDIEALLLDYPGPVHITALAGMKWPAFKACDAALAVSGTVGLELAVADVPHVIAFNMSAPTWEIVKRVVKVKHAHLGNIMLGREVVPEFLQDQCKAPVIAGGVMALMDDADAAAEQRKAFAEIRKIIQPPKDQPIADFITEVLA